MTNGVVRLPYGVNGREVRVSRELNCPTYLLPSGDNWQMLEYALAYVDSDDVREDGIITIDTPYETPLTVVDSPDPNRVFWAVYRGHRMHLPGTSPFINTYSQWPVTTTLTMYFENYHLVQVVPGEEIPPLPWMPTAQTWDDGYRSCIEFWRTHSILYSNNNTLPLSRSFEPPSWWLRQAA